MATQHILIADDRDENRYLLETLLRGHGHEVITAVHGEDALKKARQNPPDLIITDILMPVMDGFALCRAWMKDERLRSIPLIFYTATYTDERDRAFALSLGARHFIVKPADPDEFMAVIRGVFESLEQTTAKPAGRPAEAAEESVYLRQYNEALIRKLESKMEQLEKLNRELEKKVAERTARLNETIERLEELNRVFVGRELKMAELKKRIEELEKK
ncbi:MAG TPA: response regulator [Smithellaceae bacterium]|nr:response regulator [Smithellaceae bacterium]HRS83871.1 response regulator [Smithellaceae bacterium]HRV45163.1 response regulator [Smithellaceae bacterium]